MDSNTFSRERVEEIWRRVMPDADPPSEIFDTLLKKSEPPAKEEHESLIRLELELMTLYRQLADATRARAASRTLCKMANEQCVNAKASAAAYFFLYGEYYFPIEELEKAELSGYREGLRQVWNDERRLAASYIAIAERLGGQSDLGLLTLAHEHSQHSITLRALVEDSMY